MSPRKVARPRYSEDELRKIYDKTNGKCNVCGKTLSYKNYGKTSGRAPWEVDHSNPLAKGGTNNGRNLKPTCVSCNRSKGDSIVPAYRKKSYWEELADSFRI